MRSRKIYTQSTLAFASLWSLFTLTACRIGDQTQLVNPPISYSYYETAPQTLTFCAIPAPDAPVACQAASVDIIPALISDVMTDPVALRTDHSRNEFHLIGMNTDHYALPTTLQPDLSLTFTSTTPDIPLWDDEGCTTHLELTQKDGRVLPSATSTVTTPSQQSVAVSGRIQLTFQINRFFDGNCQDSLQKMSICYTDPYRCGGSDAYDNLERQYRVQSYFQNYIQADVMTATDIQTVTAIGYSVSYR